MMRKLAIAGAILLAASSALADETGRRSPYETEAQVIVPVRPAARSRRLQRTELAQPLDIRTPTQLLAVAERYVGSRRFTVHARAWCADALNAWLAKAGYHGTGDGRAISFARYGRPTGPKIGAIAVQRHHVGIVIGMTARGPVLLSGNHGHRVGVGVYSARRIIAYREPV